MELEDKRSPDKPVDSWDSNKFESDVKLMIKSVFSRLTFDHETSICLIFGWIRKITL